MRRFVFKLPVLVLAIAVAGCASQGRQRAEQAEAEAVKADEAATRAEQSAAKALDAANKATEAAERATRAVEDATREINRVAEHLDQMARDREAAIHRRRVSHVKKPAMKGVPVDAAASTPAVAPAPPPEK
jgi:flagellar biosynthesis GTPase FlhF